MRQGLEGRGIRHAQDQPGITSGPDNGKNASSAGLAVKAAHLLAQRRLTLDGLDCRVSRSTPS
jgi:hypothetical protein